MVVELSPPILIPGVVTVGVVLHAYELIFVPEAMSISLVPKHIESFPLIDTVGTMPVITTACSTVSVHVVAALRAISVTVYVPAVAYVWLGVTNVLVFAAPEDGSPKFHE